MRTHLRAEGLVGSRGGGGGEMIFLKIFFNFLYVKFKK